VVHYLGHADGLKAQLTVRENLDFWRRLWGGEAVEPALAAVGLAHVVDLPAGVLSAGQKRRVALARLLLHRRPLWLLDEPLTALDDRAEAMLGSLLAVHVAGGGMAMVATHRPLPVPVTASLDLGAAS
jgi:heme exporter protein A